MTSSKNFLSLYKIPPVHMNHVTSSSIFSAGSKLIHAVFIPKRVLPLVERTNSSIAICSFYQPKCIHILMHLQIAIYLSALSDPTCQCNLEFFCEQLQDHFWKNSRDFPIQQRTRIHHLEFSQNWHCSLVWPWNSNIWVGYLCKSLLESYFQRLYSKYSCYQ